MQVVGVLFGAPFAVLCGMTSSVTWLLIALTGWGLCKGLHDANIFASAGMMNTVGWLAGGGTAPIIIGWLARDYGLGGAIALASSVCLLAGLLLILGALRYAKHGVAAV